MASLTRPEITLDQVLLVLSRSDDAATPYRSSQLTTLQRTLEGLYNFGGTNGPLTRLSVHLNTHEDILPVAYGFAANMSVPGSTFRELLRNKASPASRERMFYSARSRGKGAFHVWSHRAKLLDGSDQLEVYWQNPFKEGIKSCVKQNPQALILLEDRFRNMFFHDGSTRYTHLLRKDQVARHKRTLQSAPYRVLQRIPPRKAGVRRRIHAYAQYIASHINKYMRELAPPDRFV